MITFVAQRLLCCVLRTHWGTASLCRVVMGPPPLAQLRANCGVFGYPESGPHFSVISLSSPMGDQSQENSLRGMGAPHWRQNWTKQACKQESKKIGGGTRPGGWKVKGRLLLPVPQAS